jgi:hypothetical protein
MFRPSSRDHTIFAVFKPIRYATAQHSHSASRQRRAGWLVTATLGISTV